MERHLALDLLFTHLKQCTACRKFPPVTELRAARPEDLTEARLVRASDVAKYADRELSMDIVGGKEVRLQSCHSTRTHPTSTGYSTTA